MARKKSKGYVVPVAERDEYKLLVQQANRQIKRNLQYLEDNNITSQDLTRTLIFNYQDKSKWAGEKMIFSRSLSGPKDSPFNSRQDYKNYIGHLKLMASAVPDDLERNYKDTIIDRLQRTANIWGVGLPDNKIPDELIEEIEGLSLEQLKHWFDIGDPEEDIEVEQYSSDDYAGVDSYENFKDITLTRLGWIKKVYPYTPNKPKKKTTKKKTNSKYTRKRR